MTEPYYSDDLVTLYHGDCLDTDEWLAADVLVTDPPYGMAYESSFNRDKRNAKIGRRIAADESTNVRDAALARWGGRSALVFGRWDCPRPENTRARLIWDRGYHGMGDLSFPWGPTDEEIYVIGEGWHGRRSSSVLRVHALMSGARNRPDHPTPKPVALMELLLEKCPSGVIADPFAGSGATLVAAVNQGRSAIGVEVEERYCELIAHRLSNHTITLGF
ncbi:methyltransferase [Gordonia phage Brandonk123]|uniref:DNA methylase n=1 Tax=Gordonia phage Brandonk123 TaxID=2079564 RepID=A0A2L0HJG6_9CAUD|nr:methyltransferase [Gordonia phage Brandonk123]AUX81848.1 DNA methylase [Gordonia phage Brandonk123]